MGEGPSIADRTIHSCLHHEVGEGGHGSHGGDSGRWG